MTTKDKKNQNLLIVKNSKFWQNVQLKIKVDFQKDLLEIRKLLMLHLFERKNISIWLHKKMWVKGKLKLVNGKAI